MNSDLNLTLLLAGVIAGAAPAVLATLGETLTEKSGFINLSLDGTILLSAMAAFVTAYKTGSLALGFISGAAVGTIVAALVAVFGIYLRQSQVAAGFVLTLMTRDLAYFLGNPYSRLQGPQVPPFPIPFLADIPFLGPIFFDHNLPVYFSLVFIALCTWFIYRTPAGLRLRAAGEHPAAAFGRGINPNALQMIYTAAGGFFAGLAGAVFSLSAKPGWGRPQGAEGIGWIALALVIFGGWNPLKAAAGAYLFSLLQVLGIWLQGIFPSVPAQVFQTAPFPLMIFTLLLMSSAQKESVRIWSEDKEWMKSAIRIFSGNAPSALGKPYIPD